MTIQKIENPCANCFGGECEACEEKALWIQQLTDDMNNLKEKFEEMQLILQITVPKNVLLSAGWIQTGKIQNIEEEKQH